MFPWFLFEKQVHCVFFLKFLLALPLVEFGVPRQTRGSAPEPGHPPPLDLNSVKRSATLRLYSSHKIPVLDNKTQSKTRTFGEAIYKCTTTQLCVDIDSKRDQVYCIYVALVGKRSEASCTRFVQWVPDSR